MLIADEHLALAKRAAHRIVLVEDDQAVFDLPNDEALSALEARFPRW